MARSVHARITILLAPLFALSFPLAEHEGWGRSPSVVLGIALLAMLILAAWRGRGYLHHEDDDPLI